jgi:SAF domain-containing protein
VIRTSSPAPLTRNGHSTRTPELSRAPSLPPPRRRRRPGLLALAVMMVVLGALGAAYLASSLSRTTSVIAVARDVPWGQAVTAADLVEADVSNDAALDPIPWSERDQVIGLVANTTLTSGSLLTREAVTATRLPPAGQQLVGIAVTQGQAPVTPLLPGDDVLLVRLGDVGSAAATTPPVAATVINSGPVGADGRRVVDVLVDEAEGPDVAESAAVGGLAIVVVASR